MIRMRLEAKVVCGRGPVSWQQGEMLAMHKIEPLVEWLGSFLISFSLPRTVTQCSWAPTNSALCSLASSTSKGMVTKGVTEPQAGWAGPSLVKTGSPRRYIRACSNSEARRWRPSADRGRVFNQSPAWGRPREAKRACSLTSSSPTSSRRLKTLASTRRVQAKEQRWWIETF